MWTRLGVKNVCFCPRPGYKNCQCMGGRGGVKKWQNSVHVVVECPLSSHFLEFNSIPIVLVVPADTNILKPFSNGGSIQILPHEL